MPDLSGSRVRVYMETSPPVGGAAILMPTGEGSRDGSVEREREVERERDRERERRRR